MHKYGAAYAKQMIANGIHLAQSLANEGFDLVNKKGVFTTSHEMLIKGSSVGGHYAGARKLFAAGISTNARVAFRQQIIRLGTQEVTRRGMKEKDMEYIAKLFKRAMLDNESPEKVKKDTMDFNHSFSEIHYSFDREFGL
jgi:glycine/serine hydroxymethyltransferase